MQVELDVSELISVEQAAAIIDAAAAPTRIATAAIGGAAGRVLAEDLLADRDYPPFDKAQMDGVAVRAADVATAGATLEVIGEIAAGAKPSRAVEPGQAVAIMTGAPMPQGADCVVPVEHTLRDGPRVLVRKPSPAGHAVARRGSDVSAGARVLERGIVLGPAQLAVAATVGASRLRVYHPPSAFVLATGDELVSTRARVPAEKIRNANNIMLTTLLGRLGVDINGETQVPDDRKRLATAIERAAKSDLLLVSGGMSMGAHDYVPKALRDAGYDLKITKVRLRPGKPFVFGIHPDARFVFGLPGNPLSAFVCTLRLAARLIRRMTGRPADAGWVQFPLAAGVVENGPREFYQPARWDERGLHPLTWKGSADVFTLAQARGLLVRPENDPARPAGDLVRVLEIPQ